MRIHNLAALIISTALLSACDYSISGTLSANKDLSLLVQKKNSANIRKTFASGDYKTKLTFDQKTKITLTIEDLQGNKSTAPFLVPKDTRFPSESGDFSIAARDSGQDYDVNGRLETKKYQSGMRRDRESCSYQVAYRVCHQVPGRDGRPPHTECHIEYRTRWGWKEIEFYDETIVRDISANLVTAAQEQVASFGGSRTDVYRHTTYEGRCY